MHERRIASTSHRHQGDKVQRYGTAQEPAAHLRDSTDSTKSEIGANDVLQEKPSEPVEEEEEEETPPKTTSSSTQTSSVNNIESIPETPEPKPLPTPESKPLETVLHMPSPGEEDSRNHPHLKAPPYVHHFDTYGLVKDITKSGFTQDQAVTIMKAVRGVLTDNMALAREELVSKSNVENETYLFRAACSELKTEIGNKRKAENEKMRSERDQLQHEVDILNQKLGQETTHLRDELKGLFDDRKMAVRQEQRGMETMV